MAGVDDFDEVVEQYHLALNEFLKANPEPSPSESSSSMSLAQSSSTFEKAPSSMKFRTRSQGALKV